MTIAVMRATMTRIRFSDAAAQAIVEEQGIDTLEKAKLSSDDEIEILWLQGDPPPCWRHNSRRRWCWRSACP